MEAQEKRHPRERFTKQLGRICRALDEVSTRDFTYKLYDEPRTCRLTVNELWVDGSYARGALTCGDLDIVVRFTKVSGTMPMPKVVNKAFFGSTPDVRYYSGTPAENMSGAEFLDAVLVWIGQDGNWQSRIDSIQTDPNAGRAARDTDSIPLRAEQMSIQGSELTLAAQWERQGMLEWEFFPLDEALLSPIPEDEIGKKERQLLGCTQRMGQKTRDLVPALWRVMREKEPGGSWSSAGEEKATLRCGGTLIHVGTPSLTLRRFESTKTKQLMLVPHPTARGPNGAWLIRRGPKHPHIVGFKKSSVFYVGKPGAPALVKVKEDFGEVGILELFDSKTSAKESIKQIPSADSEPLEIIQAKGTQVYELLSQADVIESGNEQIALTPIGKQYLQRGQGADADSTTLADPTASLPETNDCPVVYLDRR